MMPQASGSGGLGMRALLSLVLSAAALAGASSAWAESPPVTMMRDAREQVPAALLGVWKADPAASTPTARRSAIALRSFQYTGEGKLLVNFMSVGVDGRQSFGHWSLQVDGSPGYEYRSDNGSTPIAEIRLKKLDAHTFELSNLVGGELQSTGVYKLSPDGQTLTLTRNPNTPRQAVVVYRRFTGD